jgi:hypothetical protein
MRNRLHLLPMLRCLKALKACLSLRVFMYLTRASRPRQVHDEEANKHIFVGNYTQRLWLKKHSACHIFLVIFFFKGALELSPAKSAENVHFKLTTLTFFSGITRDSRLERAFCALVRVVDIPLSENQH